MHAWDVSIAEATEIQKRLRSEIELVALASSPKTIAGADISYNRFSDDFYACFVVLSLPRLEEVERVFAKGIATFPYVSGYLSFREIPTLLKAYKKLKTKPDVLMADGQGIAHPRRMGLAAHFGLVTGVPSFGCAKSHLYGVVEDPATEKGSVTYVKDPKNGDVIGACVRTKERVKPVIVSPGHRITLEESIALTFATVRGYRIPEPTRRAHNLVNQFRRGEFTI